MSTRTAIIQQIFASMEAIALEAISTIELEKEKTRKSVAEYNKIEKEKKRPPLSCRASSCDV